MRLICIRENHSDDGGQLAEERNELLAVDLETGAATVLWSGADFVSSPRISPGGDEIAWLSWNHPNLPWDDVTLHRATLGADGELVDVRSEASPGDQARMQPLWSPHGELYYLSDADNWWNLYHWPKNAVSGQQVTRLEGEIGTPAWQFGSRHFEFIDENCALIVFTQEGDWRVAEVGLKTGELINLSQPRALISSVTRVGDQFFVQAADHTGQGGFYLWRDAELEHVMTIGRSHNTGAVSIAQHLVVPLQPSSSALAGEITHAYYYPPANEFYCPLPGERPPVIVSFHGGPTAQSHSSFALRRQFWTSRGFALLDVNYRGSTGYGRDYRQRLYRNWGLVDVEDAVAVLRYAADKGLVDPKRAAIMGGSAGGFTTLAALAFSDDFTAGTNLYGVSDLTTFVSDTHKFESRYMGHLVGRWPEDRQVYLDRSPVYSADQINVPLLTLQGAEDKVVPPAQSHVIMEAVRKKGLPCAYIEFEGEQHGFRQKQTLIRAIEAELSFYGQIFGFEPAGDIQHIELENPNRDLTENER
jgi:dipeptidyl aminopeptidase/acylaminoacyl peptidase